MRMRKTLSGLLALALAMTMLTVPAFAFADDPEQEPTTSGTEPLSPEGNMALADDIEGEAAEDKQFIVVQSWGGHYFYIIIDHASKRGEHCPLSEPDGRGRLALPDRAGGTGPRRLFLHSKMCRWRNQHHLCDLCRQYERCAGVEPEPEKPDTPPDKPDAPEEPEKPEKKAGNPLMIVTVLAVLGAGGAVAYLKFFKKKPATPT